MLIKFKDIKNMNFYSGEEKIGSVIDLFLSSKSHNIEDIEIKKHFSLIADLHNFIFVPVKDIEFHEDHKKYLKTSLTYDEIEKMQKSFVKRSARIHEYEHFTYLGWPNYYDTEINIFAPAENTPEFKKNIKLQSIKDLLSFTIVKNGKDIGHVVDVLIDTENWRVVEFIVEHKEAFLSYSKFIISIDRKIDIFSEEKEIHID